MSHMYTRDNYVSHLYVYVYETVTHITFQASCDTGFTCKPVTHIQGWTVELNYLVVKWFYKCLQNGQLQVDTSFPKVAHYLKKWNFNIANNKGYGHPLFVSQFYVLQSDFTIYLFLVRNVLFCFDCFMFNHQTFCSLLRSDRMS